MEKRWILREADEGLVSLLSESLKVSPLLARILVHRGLKETAAAQRFLSSSLRSDLPSPFLMAGMEQAAERLVHALENKELICIWGDYDVDGTTGAATLVSFLKEIGGEPIYYIPHRINEGYGLNPEGLKGLISRGVRLVVTVDCGISNYQEVELARNLGIDVVIVAREFGMKLVGFALQEAVELIEAAAQRPVIERAGRRALLHGREMPLAGRERSIAVAAQHLGERRRTRRNEAAHVRETRVEIRYRAHPNRVVVAPGQQASARR